jgi:hypothetical protein
VVFTRLPQAVDVLQNFHSEIKGVLTIYFELEMRHLASVDHYLEAAPRALGYGDLTCRLQGLERAMNHVIPPRLIDSLNDKP